MKCNLIGQGKLKHLCHVCQLGHVEWTLMAILLITLRRENNYTRKKRDTMFYLSMYSLYFIYSNMASNVWIRLQSYYMRGNRLSPLSGLLFPIRSESLTRTFRASCCSARLSRAQVSAFAGSSVQNRNKSVGGGGGE